MNASVLSIQQIDGTADFKVYMLVGEQQHNFIFTIEPSLTFDHPIEVIAGDRTFSEYFKFNQHIAVQVTQLVGKRYRGADIAYPIELGRVFSPEEAAAMQKSRRERVSF